MDDVNALLVLRDISLTMNGVPPQLASLLPRSTGATPGPMEREMTDIASAGTMQGDDLAKTFTIDGGNDRLAYAFAQTDELRDRIRFDTPIARIEMSEDDRRVVCLTDDGRRFEGDRLVCAIPFSVLRTMDVAVPRPTNDAPSMSCPTRRSPRCMRRHHHACGSRPGCLRCRIPICRCFGSIIPHICNLDPVGFSRRTRRARGRVASMPWTKTPA